MGSFDLKKIEKLKDRKNVKRLLKVLDDPDYQVSAAAAETLGNIGDSTFMTPLIEAIRKNRVYDEDWIYSKAIVAIGATVVEPLIEALKHKNRNVRITAAKSLVKLYQNARLNVHQKQSILDLRGAILGTSATHHDRHSDECCLHNDHSDNLEDIVKFPL